MRQFAQWIQSGRCGSYVGLIGSGKSNMLSYFCRNPELVRRDFTDPSIPFAAVYADLNNAYDQNPATLFRILLRALYEGRDPLKKIDPGLPETVAGLYRRAEEKTDAFVVQSALREALSALTAKNARVAFILDPFDEFARTAPVGLFDNLRGLRDSFKYQLSCIVGLRKELAYLRSGTENFGELYDLLDTCVCWVGTMEEEDAKAVLDRIETVTGGHFSDLERKDLMELTGCYPALLSAAAYWLHDSSPRPSSDKWEDLLLQQPAVRNRMRDIWGGFTGKEKEAVIELLGGGSREKTSAGTVGKGRIRSGDADPLERLKAMRICRRDGALTRVISRMFERYVRELRESELGEIRYVFWRGNRKIAGLTPLDRKLLKHFLAHPREIVGCGKLRDTVWGGKDVADNAVNVAVAHLRRAIEPRNSEAEVYLTTVRGEGFQFFPEGRPKG
jgi:hypothetical protein